LKEVEKITKNLQVEENAYVAVFLTHHSKASKILDEIERNARCLFKNYKPTTLIKDEVKFFDEQADIIIKAALPSARTPEKEREEMLRIQDRMEQEIEEQKETEGKSEPLERELRRAI